MGCFQWWVRSLYDSLFQGLRGEDSLESMEKTYGISWGEIGDV